MVFQQESLESFPQPIIAVGRRYHDCPPASAWPHFRLILKYTRLPVRGALLRCTVIILFYIGRSVFRRATNAACRNEIPKIDLKPKIALKPKIPD
jgi:hypothetical protein